MGDLSSAKNRQPTKSRLAPALIAVVAALILVIIVFSGRKGSEPEVEIRSQAPVAKPSPQLGGKVPPASAPNPTKTVLPPTPPPAYIVTWRQYEEFERVMAERTLRYSDIYQTLGHEGVVVRESSKRYGKDLQREDISRTYMWRNWDGSSMSARCTNQRVIVSGKITFQSYIRRLEQTFERGLL